MRPIHFEIHADKPERAIGFYEQAFGWTFQKFEGGSMPYWLVTTGPDGTPGINGGLHPRMGPVDGEAVIGYVCTMPVENVDAHVQKVESLGGKVAVPKMPIPGMGWLAYCKDTEGNIFGMMQMDSNAR
jgi:predicted enzyme related to lactoylglutathione lyase